MSERAARGATFLILTALAGGSQHRYGSSPSSPDLRRACPGTTSLPSSNLRSGQARTTRAKGQVIKGLKMRKRNIILTLAAAPAIAVLISSCSQNVPGSNLTVQCTDTLTNPDATNGAVGGHGQCTLTGVLHDRGPDIGYRTQTPETIFIRRVITGAKGRITFLIKIPTVGGGGEPWTITSGTGAYAKLHGRGYQVVDNYTATPATFVLKGTVSPAQA